jgi:chloride channel 7
MRMTVATCVMLLELTSNLALLPMMMLVTLVAKVRIEQGFIQAVRLLASSVSAVALVQCVGIGQVWRALPVMLQVPGNTMRV